MTELTDEEVLSILADEPYLVSSITAQSNVPAEIQICDGSIVLSILGCMGYTTWFHQDLLPIRKLNVIMPKGPKVWVTYQHRRGGPMKHKLYE